MITCIAAAGLFGCASDTRKELKQATGAGAGAGIGGLGGAAAGAAVGTLVGGPPGTAIGAAIGGGAGAGAGGVIGGRAASRRDREKAEAEQNHQQPSKFSSNRSRSSNNLSRPRSRSSGSVRRPSVEPEVSFLDDRQQPRALTLEETLRLCRRRIRHRLRP